MIIMQADTSSRRVRRARARSLMSSLAIGILALGVAACTGLLAPVVWTAIVESAQPAVPGCAWIKNPAERAACLARQQNEGPAHPARGATAPLSN